METQVWICNRSHIEVSQRQVSSRDWHLEKNKFSISKKCKKLKGILSKLIEFIQVKTIGPFLYLMKVMK